MKLGRRSKRGLQTVSFDPQLMSELRQTMDIIDTAINHFEQVVDPTLIDCYIYELKAAQLRYQFLLQRIKKQEIQV